MARSVERSASLLPEKKAALAKSSVISLGIEAR